MRTVHEMSVLSGVSVRTLHHYDAIGLLKPTAVTAAGYRLYDDEAVKRLRDILLLRELGFSLREIGAALDTEGADRAAILRDQIVLLGMKRDHIERVISLAENLLKGEDTMDFSVFDTAEPEAYAREARERWGDTAAYREQEARHRTPAEQARAAEGLTAIFARFGALRGDDPASPAAQALVKELQDYITANFYTCTVPILRGLGEMYTADDRFRANIDAAGGEGTAAFAAAAIATYTA